MPVKYNEYRKNTPEIQEERKKLQEWYAENPQINTVKKDSNFADTTRYLLGKFGSGAVGGYEGIADFIAPALKSVGKITSSLVDNPVGEFIFGKDAGNPENNPIYQLGESMIRDEVGQTFSDVVDKEFGAGSAFDNNSLPTKIAAGAGRIGAAVSFGKAAGPAINIKNIDSTNKAATMLNGLINQVNQPTMQAFMMDIFGSSYADAVNNGATDEEAGAFALLETVKEGGIEMISGGVGGLFGKGAIDDYITKTLVSKATTKLGKMGIKTLTSMVGEGLEEVLAELITPFTNYVYKHDLDFSSYDNLLDSFLVGALTSGVLQGGRALYGKVLDPSTTVYEQIMGEYIDELSTDVDTYTDAQNEILDRIDNSVEPEEIVQLNEANGYVASTIEDLKLRLDEMRQLMKNSSSEKIPDVLKVVPDTTEVDTNTKGTEYEVYHGSPNVIEGDFDFSKSGSNEGQTHGDGVYFTKIKETAKTYGPNLVKANVTLKNPYEVGKTNLKPRIDEIYELDRKQPVDKTSVDYEAYYDYVEGKLDSKYQVIDYLKSVAQKNNMKLSELMRKLGYDGIVDGDYVIAYSNDQIKRADKKSAPATKKQTTKTVSEKKRGTITKDQIKTIHTLLGGGKSALKSQLYEEFGIKSSVELSKEKASEMINILKGKSISNQIESVASDKTSKVDLQNITAGTEIKGIAPKNVLDKIDKSFKKDKGKTEKEAWMQALVDVGYPIDKIADEISKTNPSAGKRLKAVYDKMYSAMTISCNQEFEAQTNYKTGEKIGASIDEILHPFEKNKTIDELRAYVYIKSNLERGKYGKSNKGIELTEEQQKEFIQRMDSLHPEYKAAQKQINKYYRNLLQNEVGGRVDQELADYLTEKYQDYAKFYDKNHNTIYIKGNKIMIASAVKEAKGGKYELDGLRESMVRATQASVSGKLENDVRLELLNCLGGVQLKVTQNYKPILETSDGWMIVAYKNGVPYGVKVNKAIVDALKKPSITEMEKELGKKLNIYQKGVQLRRKILTEYNIFFTILRNPARDVSDMVVNSKHTLATIRELPTAFWQLSTNGEIAQRYKGMGGFSSSFYGSTKKGNVITRRIAAMNQVFEQTPRLAEFIASLKKGATPEEALYDASDVTVNFKRKGTATSTADRNGALFLSSSVAGLYKNYRNIKGANGLKGYVSLLIKTVGLGIASATLNGLLYEDDEDYQNLPDYTKDNYYLFKVNDKFIRIPKGRVISVFDKAAREVNDIIKGKPKTLFDALQMIKFATDQVGVANPLSEHIFAPIAQAWANKKWTGEDIDKPYETGETGYVPPKDRVAKNSTEFAKFLSNLIPEEFNISPKKIDYVLDQYAGNYYKILKSGMTDTQEFVSFAENPLMSNLLVDTVYSNKNVTAVLNELPTEIDKQLASNKDDVELILKDRYINSQRKAIFDLYGEINDYVKEHPHNNAAKTREITKKINEMANETVEKYNNITAETITYDGKEYIMMNGETAYRYDKNGTLRKCTSKVCKEVLNSK